MPVIEPDLNLEDLNYLKDKIIDKKEDNSFDIIAELSTFISRGKSFEAEQGAHDDLVMCLVIFSWMANQRYFNI